MQVVFNDIVDAIITPTWALTTHYKKKQESLFKHIRPDIILNYLTNNELTRMFRQSYQEATAVMVVNFSLDGIHANMDIT